MNNVTDHPDGRLLLRKREAAEALGMSYDSLERHVMPAVRVVRKGGLVLIPRAELERWVEQNSDFTLSVSA